MCNNHLEKETRRRVRRSAGARLSPSYPSPSTTFFFFFFFFFFFPFIRLLFLFVFLYFVGAPPRLPPRPTDYPPVGVTTHRITPHPPVGVATHRDVGGVRRVRPHDITPTPRPWGSNDPPFLFSVETKLIIGSFFFKKTLN